MSTAHEKWLADRLQGVGASEVAALLDLDPYQSAFSLWALKTGRIPPQPETKLLYWGKKIEPILAEAYVEQTGRTLIDPGRETIRRGEHPYLFATLDREILPINDGRGPGVLECKNVDDHLTNAWADAPPLKVQVQIQAQLAVTGYSWAVAGALIGGNDDRFVEVLRHDELIEVIEDAATTFMQCVRDDVPPMVDGSSATTEALKRMFPEDSGREMDLPFEAHVYAVALEQAKSELKRWGEIESRAKNSLVAMLGNATSGRIGNAIYTYKKQHRKETVVAASDFRVLRRKELKP